MRTYYRASKPTEVRAYGDFGDRGERSAELRRAGEGGMDRGGEMSEVREVETWWKSVGSSKDL
jgi:hypothetical protein